MADLYRRPIRRIWGIEKVVVTHTQVRKDRTQMLEDYIKNNDFITEDVIASFSFPNPIATMRSYTRRKGVIFEYIGDERYVIIK
jgi:hypothetical protein